jgi:signal transduction histidine kinase/CheY-like chemotaxis protein
MMRIRSGGKLSRSTSLAQRFQRYAFLLATLLVLLLGGTIFVVHTVATRDNLQISNAAALNILASGLKTELQHQADLLHELSQSSLVGTALSDSVGREAYLRPYLRNLNDNPLNMRISLLDYRGRFVSGVAQTIEALPAAANEAIAGILNNGKPGSYLDVSNETHLYLLFPVRFPYTDDTIGVLVGDIPITTELAARASGIDSALGFGVAAGNIEFFTYPATISGRYGSFAETIKHPVLPDLYQFRIELFNTQSYWHGLFRFALIYLIVAAFMVGIVWNASSLVATYARGRLNQLMQAIKSQALSIPVDGGPEDEIAALARALKDSFAAEQARQAELSRQVAERTHELACSEELLRSAIETTGEAFAIFDPDDQLLYCNAHYRQLHAPIAHLLQAGQNFSALISALAAARIEDGASAETVAPWQAHRLAMHRNTGNLIEQIGERWVKIIEDRTPSGHFVSFYVDITEQVNARHAAEAASQAKTTFLATMSHELRTPMNGVLGMAELMLRSPLSEKQQRQLSLIKDSAASLNAILVDILDYAQIETRHLTLHPAPFSLREILDDISALFAPAAEAKAIALNLNIAPDISPQFIGDAVRVRQILNNLLANALKFTHAGSVTLAARGEPDGANSNLSWVTLTVNDTGIGIPADKQALVFEAFKQADGSHSRQYGGTGLGLTISRRLAEAMGGTLTLESTPGLGSSLILRLPLEIDHSVPAAAPAADEPTASTAETSPVAPAPAATSATSALSAEAEAPEIPGLPHRRVLVVEDNMVNRVVLRSMLEKASYHVTLAEDGIEAVTQVRSHPFALILMDIQMPLMDGIAATRAIRELERKQGKRVPIIAVTANVFESDRQACTEAGMDDFLAKPVKLNDLLTTIEKYLPLPEAAHH